MVILTANKRLTIFGTIAVCRTRFANEKYGMPYIGGNGILASLAASNYVDVDMVGVVGSDIGTSGLSKILGPSITLDNVEVLEGESFKYDATYSKKSAELIQEETKFGVYKEYSPNVKSALRSEQIFFSGGNPKYALNFIEQINGPTVIAVSTLLYHLKNTKEYALKLIDKASILFTNKMEYQFLSETIGEDPLFYFKKLECIFNTNGSKGVNVAFSNGNSVFFSPPKVVTPLNPTNAGDVFAGTVVGMLSAGYKLSKDLDRIVKSAGTEAAKVILNDAYYRRVIP